MQFIVLIDNKPFYPGVYTIDADDIYGAIDVFCAFDNISLENQIKMKNEVNDNFLHYHYQGSYSDYRLAIYPMATIPNISNKGIL